jgi:hypothetical protein
MGFRPRLTPELNTFKQSKAGSNRLGIKRPLKSEGIKDPLKIRRKTPKTAINLEKWRIMNTKGISVENCGIFCF